MLEEQASSNLLASCFDWRMLYYYRLGCPAAKHETFTIVAESLQEYSFVPVAEVNLGVRRRIVLEHYLIFQHQTEQYYEDTDSDMLQHKQSEGLFKCKCF